MTLLTDRLRLRPATMDDAALFLELDSDPEVVRWAQPELIDDPLTPEQIRSDVLAPLHEARTAGRPGDRWIAETREGGEFLGWFFLRPDAGAEAVFELGYRLRRAAWGHGYATEGARRLMAHAFDDLGAQRLVATAVAPNRASINVLEKLGFTYERSQDWRGYEDRVYVLERPV